MSTIGDTARIVFQGEPAEERALYSIVREHGGSPQQALLATHIPLYCAQGDCLAIVSKPGNFCSIVCHSLAMNPAQAEHESPCVDKDCVDLECLVRWALRRHLLLNIAEKDRPKAQEVTSKALDNLLASSEHGDKDPDWFVQQVVEHLDDFLVNVWPNDPLRSAKHAADVTSQTYTPEQVATAKHVQVAKPVLESPAKVTRKPSTKKHQPRTTDDQEHPVVVTTSKEQTVKTYTQADMERAIKEAVAKAQGKRVKDIKAAKAVQGAPEDKPVEIVKKTGGRTKIERIKEPEGKGVVMEGFVVDNTLTVDDLHIGDLSLDTVVSSATRSIYNKARFRLSGEPVLDTDVTYRTLAKVHASLFERANAKTGKKVSVKAVKAAEQAEVIAAGAPNKTHVWKGKAVTAKQYAYYTRNQTPAPTVAVAINTSDKAQRKAKVKALMEHLGLSKQEAKALVAQQG